MEPDLLPSVSIPAPGTRRAAKARRGGRLEQQRQEEVTQGSAGRPRSGAGRLRGGALRHPRPSCRYGDLLALPFVLVLSPSSRVLGSLVLDESPGSRMVVVVMIS